MRNVFDQYKQPENRLTHALVISLSEDPRLLKNFVRWITGRPPPKKILKIVEQRLPGEAEGTEDESERRGLPDAWIHDDESWSLLVESKVSASLKNEQLLRHQKTAIRRGFTNISILAIDLETPRRTLLHGVIIKTWSEIYSWLFRQSKYSEWALKTLRYMEIADAKLPIEGYLKEGTLTTFSGIPFDKSNAYNYIEAKRALKLAMDDLRKRRDLMKELRIDPGNSGRGMITGKNSNEVWDYLSLKAASGKKGFTRYPHITLSIERDRLIAITTIPNQIYGQFRKNLIALGEDGFFELMLEITKRLQKAIRKERWASPIISSVQRRYLTQSSPPIIDARLSYDLRTAFYLDKRSKPRIKQQPEWLSATFGALSHKKSNYQVSVGSSFPYDYCKAHKEPVILDYIANSWIACKPLIDTLLAK